MLVKRLPPTLASIDTSKVAFEGTPSEPPVVVLVLEPVVPVELVDVVDPVVVLVVDPVVVLVVDPVEVLEVEPVEVLVVDPVDVNTPLSGLVPPPLPPHEMRRSANTTAPM